MLETAFSFRGRTTRLGYFKGCVGLVLAGLIPAVLVLLFIVPIGLGSTLAMVMLIALLVAFAVAITWIGLALNTRRCRDMGWSPIVVIPAWIVVQGADALVAHLNPSLAF